MESLLPVLWTAYNGDATLKAALPNKLWRLKAPAGTTMPYGVMLLAGNAPMGTAGGQMIERPRVQFNCYSATESQAEIAAAHVAVKALYDNYVAQSGGQSYQLTRIFDDILVVDGEYQSVVEYRVVIVPTV